MLVPLEGYPRIPVNVVDSLYPTGGAFVMCHQSTHVDNSHIFFIYLSRGWEKFHTPRNICLALSGEAGELCELFQFKDEEACCTGLPGWTRDERDKLSQVKGSWFLS